MNKLLGAVATGTLLAIVMVPAFAQQNISRRIDLNLVDAAPGDVFETFAGMLGAKLELSPAVEGRVTVRLQNVMVATAIEVVCESIGCRSELAGGEAPILRILPLPPKAKGPIRHASRDDLSSPGALSVKDAAAMDILASFSRILNAELRVQGGSTETVTLELQGVPMDQILDAVAATLRMRWDLSEESVDGKVHRILEFSRLTPPAASASRP